MERLCAPEKRFRRTTHPNESHPVFPFDLFTAPTKAGTKTVTASDRFEGPKHRIFVRRGFWFLYDTENCGMHGVDFKEASTERHLRSKIR